MRIELNKQYGPALVNLLRQVSMTACKVLRPIAFSTGAHSNVLDTSDSAIEDMTTFIDNVTSANYYVTNQESSELIRFDATVARTLDTSQFQSEGILCKENKVVLNTIADLNVSIIFRYTNNRYTAKENVLFLQKQHINTDEYIVIPSRHCAVDSFTQSEIESEDSYVVDIDIKSDVCSAEQILDQTMKTISEQVEKLGQKIKESQIHKTQKNTTSKYKKEITR